MTDSTLVELKDVAVTLNGHPVIHPTTFTLRKGTVTALLGPSGSGKTTLLRSIVGTQQHSGTITRHTRRPIGYATQAASVYDDLTVGENLTYFAALSNTRAPQHLLDALGIADLTDRIVSTLSGGQRGRVSLACALVGEPEVIIMDEPTVGLDPVARNKLWSFFHSLAHDHGAALVLSSHILDEASRCDRLLFLHEGTVLFAGTSQELLSHTNVTDGDLDRAFLRLIETAEPMKGHS